MQCMQSAILLWEIGLSVCLSVCPSSTSIVSKRMHINISLHLFDALLAAHSSIFEFNRRYNIKGVSWILIGDHERRAEGQERGCGSWEEAATLSTPVRGL